MKKTKNKSNIDEIPKALKKRSTKKEEKEFKTRKELKQELKEEKKKSRKRKIIKLIIFIVLVYVIYSIISFAISINRFKKLVTDMITNENSQVIDTNGNVIAQIGSEKKKQKIDTIPENLKRAYVAIEDQRYYNHGGIDLKRTCAAIGNYVIHFGKSSFGGSSITQQLVKNLTGDDSSKISRKISEWEKAIYLETFLSKDEILDIYLNIIYVGPNIYGVETGSQYYFSKSVSELSLAESAYLAGINNSPNSYNPFTQKDNTEKITKRTKTVLYKMKELGYIEDTKYNQAISEVEGGLKFKKTDIKADGDGIYSYHTDALISEVILDIQEKYKISEDFATNYLNMAGLKIYSTQDTSIQEKMEKEFTKGKYILKSSKDSNVTSQSAMVVIDHKTGYVIGCIRRTWKKIYCKRIK